MHGLKASACLMVMLFACYAAAVQANAMAMGTLVNPEVVPAGATLPQRAIDSNTIPQFSLASQIRDETPLPVYRIAADTYFLFGAISTVNDRNRGWNGNAGFVVTPAGVVVIDTLGTPRLGKRMIASIAAITDKPIKYLIITHSHPDHAYGVAAFRELPNVTVIAHKGTVDYNHSADIERSVVYRRELLGTDMDGFEPVQADLHIGGARFTSTRITLGGRHFDIYNTGRHHSSGDLLVHQVQQDIVWISDLAFNQRTTYMGDGHSREALEAQDWLLKNFGSAALMVPGHGAVQTKPFPMVARTRDYIQRMRAAMRDALENDTPLLEAVRQVEFEDWQTTHLYEQNQRANANFIYREMEQEFFE